MGLREQIKAAKQKTRQLEIPELGGKVFVKNFSYADTLSMVEQVEAFKTKPLDIHNLSSLVAQNLCEEDGTLVYDPDNKADLEEMANDLTFSAMLHIVNQITNFMPSDENVVEAKKN